MFFDRVRTGTAVLVVTVIAAVLLDRQGIDEGLLYMSVFALAALLTFVGLLKFDRQDKEARSNIGFEVDSDFRKVLLLEYQAAFDSYLRTVLVSQGAHVDAINASEDLDHAQIIHTNYDLILADAQLPYVTLASIKSTLEKDAPEAVLLVISVTQNYPATPPSTRSLRILEAVGPRKLRREAQLLLQGAGAY
jgi:hypothetical protein